MLFLVKQNTLTKGCVLNEKLTLLSYVRLNIGKDGKYVIVTKNSVIDENGKNWIVDFILYRKAS